MCTARKRQDVKSKSEIKREEKIGRGKMSESERNERAVTHRTAGRDGEVMTGRKKHLSLTYKSERGKVMVGRENYQDPFIRNSVRLRLRKDILVTGSQGQREKERRQKEKEDKKGKGRQRGKEMEEKKQKKKEKIMYQKIKDKL